MTMATERSAQATWQGDLIHGSGEIHEAPSGAFGPLQVSWAARSEEQHGGKTSPEELIAAAHASCYAMAFSHELAEAGATPEHLDVSATVTFEVVNGAPSISRDALTERGKAGGIDADGFAKVAAAAKEGCPVSRALKGNVEITLDASLA
jgi:osmotically inducible protein OsmC